MTPYCAQHDAFFRTVAEILVRDYIAPSETADTVAEWCEGGFMDPKTIEALNPYELADGLARFKHYETLSEQDES